MPHINFNNVVSIKPDPSLLVQPMIVKPLMGTNPRTILGAEWWDEERKRAYDAYHYLCAACGKAPDCHPISGLHAHEMYNVDWEKAKVTYTGAVALATSCHSFIHLALLNINLVRGKVTKQEYKDTIKYCLDILNEAGLRIPVQRYRLLVNATTVLKHDPWIINVPVDWKSDSEQLQWVKKHKWSDWKLVINGKEYSPIHKSEKHFMSQYNGGSK